MMEDKEDQSLLYQLNGKIIESEFLACCMCSSFKWDYGNGKIFFTMYIYINVEFSIAKKEKLRAS